VRLAALLLLAAFALAGPADAGSKPNAAEVETELVCPVCHETLDQSTAPIAQEMKATIRRRIAQGWTKKQIIDEMVANFGPQVLSTPSTHGFDALAWILPIGGALIGVAALAYGASYWTRTAPVEPEENVALDPDLERRVDEELSRFNG